MSEVTLSIAGREYTVACAEGEEAHVARLGQLIDSKLQDLGENLSPQESQNLLFGALFVADELHEEKKAAASAKATLEKHGEELADAKREATLANGQRDELTQKIADLEKELDGLQSAQQKHSADLDGLREELERKAQALTSAEAETAKLNAELNETKRKRDNLAKTVDSKNELLERANEHMNEINAKLKESQNSPPSGGEFSALAGDPDLAPALERFADLLENCADKLESEPAST